MYFSLRSAGQEQQSTECYFRMHADGETIYSPLYPDRAAALAAMEKLVLGLRNGSFGSKSQRRDGVRGYSIPLFGRRQPAVGDHLFFSEKEEAYQRLMEWQAAAKANTYKLLFWELAEDPVRFPSVAALDLGETDEAYAWREAGSSLFNLSQKKGLQYKPSVGLQANLNRGPCEPVFNALQPFVSADLPLFHGRKREVDEIYTLLQRRPLLLLYGAAKVGKTSLLQCGLANRLDKDKEHMVVVRREEDDILATLNAALRKELGEKEESALLDPMVLANRLAEVTGKRIFLVFDQLERFFTTDVYDAERHTFFGYLSEWLAREHNPFRIVLALQEGFLAPVAEYEEQLPALLDNRYRLLPLKESSMVDATLNLLDVLSLQKKVAVDEPRVFAEKACGQLVNEKGEVPLQCLQIYLHQLHQKSCQETTDGPVPLNPDLIDRFGPAPVLIDEFIDQRTTNLKARLPSDDAPPDPALEQELAELEDSQQRCGSAKRQTVVAAAAVAPVPIPAPIPWASVLALAAIPFGLFFLYWWFSAEDDPLTACELTTQVDSCEAYLNYLCTYGDTSECATDFRTILDAKDCAIWRDYRVLEEVATCGAYQQFYAKYQDRGICLETVRANLLAWECPVVRDTLRITQRDTVIRRIRVPAAVPQRYANPISVTEPPCKVIGQSNFKQVGPLWIMTEPLYGGPFAWEDALEACAARGFRLPCTGEISFLIEEIYGDDPQNAYAMLTGTGACSLVNPGAPTAGGKVEFWTATEANDATAWSYFFDIDNRTLVRQSGAPKSARLPCLCVQKDPDATGSALPPCYQKNIDRRTSK